MSQMLLREKKKGVINTTGWSTTIFAWSCVVHRFFFWDCARGLVYFCRQICFAGRIAIVNMADSACPAF